LFAADPAIGTWKLNVSKSTFKPGPPPKAATITYSAAGDGVKRTGETVNAAGAATRMEYTATYDGKDYPITGSSVADSISLQRVDEYTVEGTLKKAGRVVSTVRRSVSKDGKTLTFNINGTNRQGQTVRNVSLYEKQ
jgi:hypothetical protein